MKTRIVTAILLMPPVLLAVFLSTPWPLFVLAAVLLFVSHAELRRMAGLSPRGAPVAGCLALLLVLPVLGWVDWSTGFVLVWGQAPPSRRLEPWVLPLALFACSAVGTTAALAIARGVRGFVIADAASLWIAAPLASMLLLKLPVRTGSVFDWGTPLSLCLVPVWIGDTAAILVGRAWGRRLLAPAISPKKTVEGALANLFGCLVGAIALATLIGQPPVVGILAGLAAGTLGQSGDLLESAMKRSAGVKDSGSLLPGHGGLLDRVDSVLLSAPAVALVVAAFGSPR